MSQTDKKEVQYYLVKYESDWSDEMTIEGFALLTNKDKEFFDSLTEDDLPLTHHIGTNEEIEYHYLIDLLAHYTWTSISKKDYNLISKLLGTDYGHFFYPEKLEIEDDENDDTMD